MGKTRFEAFSDGVWNLMLAHLIHSKAFHASVSDDMLNSLDEN